MRSRKAPATKPTVTHETAGPSRRSFVKTSTAAAAIAGVSQGFAKAAWAAKKKLGRLPTGRVIGANDRINVAYVGVGTQGMTHVDIGKEHAKDFNIAQVAVCDVYDKPLHRAQATLGLPDSVAVKDHRRLMDRADIDAVVVATVDNWHADVAIDAMDAGKHVLGEKPMARYLEEGFRMYDTAKRTNRVFQIGSQFCIDEKYHEAARWIREGRIGPLVWAQGGYCRNNKGNSEWTHKVDPDANAQNLDWNRWLGRAPRIPFNPAHYASWHKYFAYNSGILGNLLSHTFLPLLLATGQNALPSLVTCTGTREVSTDREIPDTTHLLAEMPGGLTFCVVGSTVNEQGLPPMIRGLKGTIYLPLSQNKARLEPERTYAEETDLAEFSNPEPPASVARLEKNFYDCIRSGDKPVGDIHLALQSHVILSLAEQAQRTGMTLHFDAETRTIRDGQGNKIRPLGYDTRLPVAKPVPLTMF